MTDRYNVKVSVVRKKIFGSVSLNNKYDDDRLVDLIAWLQERLAEVPPEHRETACVEIDSVGGYEGAHHPEIEIYYKRPETDDEVAARLVARRRSLQEEAARHAYLAEQAKAALSNLKD